MALAGVLAGVSLFLSGLLLLAAIRKVGPFGFNQLRSALALLTGGHSTGRNRWTAFAAVGLIAIELSLAAALLAVAVLPASPVVLAMATVFFLSMAVATHRLHRAGRVCPCFGTARTGQSIGKKLGGTVAVSLLAGIAWAASLATTPALTLASVATAAVLVLSSTLFLKTGHAGSPVPSHWNVPSSNSTANDNVSRRLVLRSAMIAVPAVWLFLRTPPDAHAYHWVPHNHCQSLNWKFRALKCVDGWWVEYWDGYCSVCGHSCDTTRTVWTGQSCV